MKMETNELIARLAADTTPVRTLRAPWVRMLLWLAISLPYVAAVVLFGAAWPLRALIRAQLIEDGFEVVAVDTWTELRRRLRPGHKPRAAILDLKDLENPSAVLSDLSLLMRPERVLVIAASGAVPCAEIERLEREAARAEERARDRTHARTRAQLEMRLREAEARVRQEVEERARVGAEKRLKALESRLGREVEREARAAAAAAKREAERHQAETVEQLQRETDVQARAAAERARRDALS